jgi:hypothetical protein
MNSAITIIRGEDRTIQLGIREANGGPYNLTSVTEIKIYLENEDGTSLDLKYTDSEISIVSEVAGIIAVTITVAQSALLKTGNSMDMQASITIGGLVRKVLFEGLLTVIEDSP